MKTMFPVLLILLGGSALFAQPVDTLWTRVVGGPGAEDASSVVSTSDGGFLIGGTTDSFGAGGTDFYFVRLDSIGDTLWTRAYGHRDDDVCTALVQRPDGLYLASGYSFNRGAGHWGIDILQINDAGDLVGESVTGSTTADWFAYDLELTSDGGYVMVGSHEDSTGSRMLLRKFDAAGLLQFEEFIAQGFSALARNVEQTADGGYILAGSTRESDDAPDDFLLARTDADGNVLWIRTFGTATADQVTDLVALPDGGFAFTGPTDVFSEASDFFLARLNAAGDTLWTRNYGGLSGDRAMALIYAANGFVLVGRTDSFGEGGDIMVVRTDSSGSVEWTETFGGAGLDIAKAVAPAADLNGYIIAGTTTSFGAGDSNLYLIRLGTPEGSDAPDGPEVVNRLALEQNYPNPFNPTTRIAFSLHRTGHARLRVFDVTGREVAKLVDSELSAGDYSVSFNGRNLPSGAYFYRLETGTSTLIRRMQLLK